MASDEEIMGGILQTLHERRYNDLVNFNEAFVALGAAPNVLRSNLSRLEQKGLIKWLNNEVRGFGLGNITDYGIEVVEKKRQPPIPMVFQQITIHGSSNFVIGQGNTQSVSIDVGKLIAAIDHSNATDGERAAAKSLLQKIAENPLLNTILGGLIKGASGG